MMTSRTMQAMVRATVTAVTGVLAVAAMTGPRPDGARGSGVAAPAAFTPSASALSRYLVALQWGSCPASVAQAPFQCATAPVPLDYRAPGGARIELSLIRLPAAEPSERIGSLFINFGGPGGSGVNILPARAATVFSPAIRDHFDLVSWDTRGTGGSTAVRCFATQQDDSNYFASVPYFPYPAANDASFWSLNAQLGQDCEQRAGTLLPHLSTARLTRCCCPSAQLVAGGGSAGVTARWPPWQE